MGAVSVVVSPSVIGNLVGAFRYMRDYPYSCWEQTLSVGVMASHYGSLRDYLPADFQLARRPPVCRKPFCMLPKAFRRQTAV